jgi:predicted nuclease of restriction endonuclease-like (RecB) superfamily
MITHCPQAFSDRKLITSQEMALSVTTAQSELNEVKPQSFLFSPLVLDFLEEHD